MNEIFKFAVRNLSQQRLRTGLTLLGVIIGIAAVVALVSISGGLANSVEESLEQLGPNNIIVSPKMGGGFGAPVGVGQELNDRDLEIIRDIKDVKHAIPTVFKSMAVEFEDESNFLTILGIPPEEAAEFFEDVQSMELFEGRFIKEGERNNVVIGYNIYKNSFSREVRMRGKLQIAGENFRVVGIIEETGNSQDDSSIMMSIDRLRELAGDEDEISYILVKVYEDPKRTAEKIEQELADYHNEELFSAITTEQLIEQINSIFGILSLVLTSIAAISLLVAGIGIMNIMLTVVLERTREIGVMKAIGATNKRILSMFLVESAIVGLIGGIVGVILGYAIGFGLSGIASGMLGLKLLIEVDAFVVGGALFFAMIIGTLSGFYPAYRASKLQPVDALRYE